MNILSSFGSIEPLYEAYIVDVWGVLTDGKIPFTDAIFCLDSLRSKGKKIILLTNSPRRTTHVMQKLHERGIHRGLYDDILASGEVTYQYVNQLHDKTNEKLRYLYIGHEVHAELIADLALKKTDDLSTANFILLTGPFSDGDDVSQYDNLLKDALRYEKTIICANPDLYVMKGKVSCICAGSIAAKYQSMGGKVLSFGKPNKTMYQQCLEKLNCIASRVLAIGDNLLTDILGASSYHIDSLWITSGVHKSEFLTTESEQKNILNIIEKHKISPKYAMKNLSF